MYEEYQSRSGRTQEDEKDYTSRHIYHDCGYVVWPWQAAGKCGRQYYQKYSGG